MVTLGISRTVTSDEPPLPFVARVIAGPDAGVTAQVIGRITVGTSPLCDLRLTDPAVSRRHCVIEVAGRRARVIDATSRNGTLVGEVGVHDVLLRPGAHVAIGSSVLQIDVDRGRVRAALDHAPPMVATGRGIGRFVAVSPQMLSVIDVARRAALVDRAVLIEGEHGTGKLTLAEAIHAEGPRRDQPFVVAHCDGQGDDGLAVHLFGDEGGGGVFAEAAGGTLVLAEVGALSLALQARLVRALDRTAPRTQSAAARVICTTHRNLERAVEDGALRADLFHRLAAVVIDVPPLRERMADIPALARAALIDLGVTEHDAHALLTDPLLKSLAQRAWPGNVRELFNVVGRVALLGEPAPAATATGVDGFGAILSRALPYSRARSLVLTAFTEAYVADMLGRHGGNVTKAAEAARIARRHFHRLLKR